MTQKPREWIAYIKGKDLRPVNEWELDALSEVEVHVREVLPDENKVNWDKVWELEKKWDKETYPMTTSFSKEFKEKIQELVEKSLRGELK